MPLAVAEQLSRLFPYTQGIAEQLSRLSPSSGCLTTFGGNLAAAVYVFGRKMRRSARKKVAPKKFEDYVSYPTFKSKVSPHVVEPAHGPLVEKKMPTKVVEAVEPERPELPKVDQGVNPLQAKKPVTTKLTKAPMPNEAEAAAPEPTATLPKVDQGVDPLQAKQPVATNEAEASEPTATLPKVDVPKAVAYLSYPTFSGRLAAAASDAASTTKSKARKKQLKNLNLATNAIKAANRETRSLSPPSVPSPTPEFRPKTPPLASVNRPGYEENMNLQHHGRSETPEDAAATAAAAAEAVPAEVPLEIDNSDAKDKLAQKIRDLWENKGEAADSFSGSFTGISTFKRHREYRVMKSRLHA